MQGILEKKGEISNVCLVPTLLLLLKFLIPCIGRTLLRVIQKVLMQKNYLYLLSTHLRKRNVQLWIKAAVMMF